MKQSARFKSKVITFATGVMLLAGLSFGAGSASAADPITSAPKLGVVSDGGHTIDPKYSFVPRITSTTKLVTYGSPTWRNTTWSDTDKRVFRSIELTHPTNLDSLKGKIGAKYTNVGYFNGESVDLQIRVTGWKRWGNTGKSGTAARVGNISFEEKNIALSTQGYEYVDTEWSYVKSGTTTPIKVSGYFTFSDIDVSQGLAFSKATSINIHKYLIADRKNKLKFVIEDEQHKFYDTTDADRPDTLFDDQHAFTFLYGNLTTFSLRWSTDWSKSDNAGIRGGKLVTKDRLYYLNTEKYAGGEYLFFVINKPGQTAIPKPTKSVSPATGYKIGDQLKYTVAHNVPQEDPVYYYKSYEMTDILNPILKNANLTIVNEAGKNMTSWFDVRMNTGKVTATAKADTLKKSAFYGDTYRFIIRADVDRAKLVSAVGSASSYTLTNTGTITTNKGSASTNEVKTVIPKRVLTVRHIDDATNAVITSTTKPVFDGESYTEIPRTDLKKGSLTYKATSPHPKTGVVDGRNVTVDFRYLLPSGSVGLDKIEIYTSKITDGGLRTIVGLASHLPGSGSMEDRLNGRVSLQVIDKKDNRSVYSTSWPVGSLPDDHEFKLPSAYMTKGAQVNYDFKLTVPEAYTATIWVPVTEDNPTGRDYEWRLKYATETVVTHGFSSSEEQKTEADITADGQLVFEGVIKTLKEGSAPVVEYDESLVVDIPELPKQKTGYGFTAGVDATYMNDLRNMHDVKMAFLVDSDLIDSHLNFPEAGDLRRVNLEQTVKVSPDTKSVTTKHELPKVKVERYSGQLFTDKQVTDGDTEMDLDVSDINYISAGRKLFAPIWATVGLYDYGFISTASVGVHAVTFDVKNELDIYAHMFNHKDSGTEQDDELLIHPLEQMTDSELADWPLGEAPEN